MTDDELERLRRLVAQIMLEQLDQGLLEKLTQAARRPADQVIRVPSIPSAESFGTPTVITSGMTGQLQPLQSAFEGNVEEIRQVSPELADKIEESSPQDKTALLNVWSALSTIAANVLTTLHLLSPQPPPPAHFEQICINTINCVINAPPAHN